MMASDGGRGENNKAKSPRITNVTIFCTVSPFVSFLPLLRLPEMTRAVCSTHMRVYT